MRKSVATSVTQFVLAGLAAVVLISAGTIYVVRRNATSEAIRNARDIAGIDGRAVAEPTLADGVLGHDPTALARLNTQAEVREHSSAVRIGERDVLESDVGTRPHQRSCLRAVAQPMRN